MELDDKGIATGETKEEKKQRKQFIIDFYGEWIASKKPISLFKNIRNGLRKK
ncbi:hypothetical protein AGMMS50262_11880 [Bacteroidia bacterium]|nr:hypothetical protein AGMMS50262_11880 [Bacteroidia bacterium]GHU68873.1 hypothetical protein AGMMS49983_21820 [Clostridia bacterium]